MSPASSKLFRVTQSMPSCTAECTHTFGAIHSIKRLQCPERINHLLKDTQRAEDTIRSQNGDHMTLRILFPLPTQ